MATMHSASVSRLRSEFDAFLFAPIGDEKNGMLLSVLSALARSDVDPWAEAAKFARMSAEAATEKMTSLIAALPDRPPGQPDPRTIAARLIALLPRRENSNASPEHPALKSGVATRSQTLLFDVHDPPTERPIFHGQPSTIAADRRRPGGGLQPGLSIASAAGSRRGTVKSAYGGARRVALLLAKARRPNAQP
jgi:hypothetical protein